MPVGDKGRSQHARANPRNSRRPTGKKVSTLKKIIVMHMSTILVGLLKKGRKCPFIDLFISDIMIKYLYDTKTGRMVLCNSSCHGETIMGIIIKQ